MPGKQRGANARVSIDGTFLSCQRYRSSSSSQAINVSNTEGTPGNPDAGDSREHMAKLPDLHEGQFELTMATFDDTEDPFGAPINLEDGTYYAIEYFPAGSGNKWDFPNALCVFVSGEGTVPGPQPVTARFETDGSYSLP